MEDPNLPLTEPQKPEIGQFAPQPQGVTTRSAGPASTITGPTTIANLTMKERAGYQLIYIIYRDNREQYQR